MNILIASDKFKDALSQEEANRTIAEVIKRVLPGAAITAVSLSDGGDGFLDVVEHAIKDIERVTCTVSDPLGRPVRGSYLFDRKGKKAYVELAEASGLALLRSEERRVMQTTTLGTGELMKHAESRGAKFVYIGLGGSATNDAGMGIAHAMGYRFSDKTGKELYPCGSNLPAVSGIRLPEEYPLGIRVFAVNDVNNPLFGPEGAARVYGPQKGASEEEIEYLDNGLRHLSRIVEQRLQKDIGHVKGGGAAGGTAFGLMAFLDADFVNGAEFMLNLQGVTERLEKGFYDLVITGEGSLDDQTSYGKLVSGLSRVAGKASVPVIAFCGVNALKERTASDLGLAHIVAISDPDRELEYNLKNADRLLDSKAYDFFKEYFKTP